MKNSFKIKLNSITIVLVAIVVLFFYTACGSVSTETIDIQFDPETTPSMNTDSVTTLISDSGITRYKLVADNWQVFDKAAEPFWYFPEGIYLEQFDSLFQVKAKVLADSAWNYTDKRLWRLKGNVDIRNMEGEVFSSDELFWDQKEHKVYSDKYIQILRSDGTELKGYGFESNQEMTEYRIFRPHDGKIPFKEDVENPLDDEQTMDNDQEVNAEEPDKISIADE